MVILVSSDSPLIGSPFESGPDLRNHKNLGYGSVSLLAQTGMLRGGSVR